jgi:hypothetical protein
MLKKINYIFSLEDIFDTVKAKSDKNDMKGKRV